MASPTDLLRHGGEIDAAFKGGQTEMSARTIKKFRLTRAIERRRNRERYARIQSGMIYLTIVADASELGPQPIGPIEWTPEAHAAFDAEYGKFRRWPGTPLYPHAIIAKCLTAAWRAQGLPLIQFSSVETNAWSRAHHRAIEEIPMAYTAEGRAERGLLIKTRALDAALAAYHACRVTPLVTRSQLRAKQRAERVADLKLREEVVIAKLRAKVNEKAASENAVEEGR